MSETANDAGVFPDAGAGEDPSAMERRIFRGMCWAAALAAAASAPLAPWRVTTGLLLGGVLALLNHHWLRTSVAAVFGAAPAGARPKMRAARYVLRYVVVAVVVAVVEGLDRVGADDAVDGPTAASGDAKLVADPASSSPEHPARPSTTAASAAATRIIVARPRVPDPPGRR
jgi:hypothetical protein